MSDKQQVAVIITAGYNTNRTYVARCFAQTLTELGVEVDMTSIGLVDDEPPCDVEKGPQMEMGEGFRYVLSEHMLSVPFQLDIPCGQELKEPTYYVKPAVQHSFPFNQTGIAVIGRANTGKSTIINLFSDFLKSKGVEGDQIEFNMYDTVGHEVVQENLRECLAKVKHRIVVKMYTRRTLRSNSLDVMMRTFDGYKEPIDIHDGKQRTYRHNNTIEAIQWTGENNQEVIAFLGKSGHSFEINRDGTQVSIATDWGTVFPKRWDYITVDTEGHVSHQGEATFLTNFSRA